MLRWDAAVELDLGALSSTKAGVWASVISWFSEKGREVVKGSAGAPAKSTKPCSGSRARRTRAECYRALAPFMQNAGSYGSSDRLMAPPNQLPSSPVD